MLVSLERTARARNDLHETFITYPEQAETLKEPTLSKQEHYRGSRFYDGVTAAMKLIGSAALIGDSLTAFERRTATSMLKDTELSWRVFGPDNQPRDWRERIYREGQTILESALGRLESGHTLDNDYLQATQAYAHNVSLTAVRQRPAGTAYRMWVDLARPVENIASQPQPQL